MYKRQVNFQNRQQYDRSFSRNHDESYYEIDERDTKSERRNYIKQKKNKEKKRNDGEGNKSIFILITIALIGVIVYQYVQLKKAKQIATSKFQDYDKNQVQTQRKNGIQQQIPQKQASHSQKNILSPTKSIFDTTFINPTQKDQIIKLLKPLNLEQQFTIIFNQRNPDQHIYSLSRAILKQPNYFIVFILTSDKHIFGVYVNRNSKTQSFIFSLDRKTISKINPNRIHFLLEIDQQYEKGPRFGKQDIKLFYSTNYYNCNTQFCYSFDCPDGHSYGTYETNNYLAGSKEFHVDEMFILGSKV